MTLPIDREVEITKDKTDNNINTDNDKDCSAGGASGIEYSCYSMGWHTNGSKIYCVDSHMIFVIATITIVIVTIQNGSKKHLLHVGIILMHTLDLKQDTRIKVLI